MGMIFDKVLDHFRENNLKFEQIKGQTILTTGFHCTNLDVRCILDVKEEREIILFYSLLPFKAPEGKRQSLAEFLTRANYRLMIGNFEMDLSDGEVRYKTSLCAQDLEVTSRSIAHLIQFNLNTFDQYIPGMMSLLYGEGLPKDAVDQIERTLGKPLGLLPVCTSPRFRECRFHREGSCVSNDRESSLRAPDGHRQPCPFRQVPSSESPKPASPAVGKQEPCLLVIMGPEEFAFFDALLKMKDFRCENVPTFEEAIEKVTGQNPYDLILMFGDDTAALNRMAWPAFVGHVKKNNPRTPVLLMSHNEQALKEGLTSGCDAVENIPFDIDEFLESVTGLISKKRKE